MRAWHHSIIISIILYSVVLLSYYRYFVVRQRRRRKGYIDFLILFYHQCVSLIEEYTNIFNKDYVGTHM